jgi:hypothetical protein
MARKVTTAVGVNLTAGSPLAAGSTTVYIPEYGLGDRVVADSGVYQYLQANGAVAEGYICKFVEGTFDADIVTTGESAAVNTPLGVCVTSGGLADNQYGWFWRGDGQDYVYLTASITIDTQITTHTTAGNGSTGGDPIHDLFNTVASPGSAALTLCRSATLLNTNSTITN